MEKKKVSATESVMDIRSGMSDAALMEKYRLLPSGLQSLFDKLVGHGYIDLSEIHQRRPDYLEMVAMSTAFPQSQEHEADDVRQPVRSGLHVQVNAQEVTRDIRSGMDDSALMEKYKLSSKGLQSLFNKLKDVRLIQQIDIDRRGLGMDHTVEDSDKIGEKVSVNVFSSREGVPLTPTSSKPIIRLLFQEKPQWRRKDLAVAVEKFHESHGGVAGSQDPSTVIKNALKQLEADGEAIRVQLAYSFWRRADAPMTTVQPRELEPQEEDVSSEDLDVLQVLDEIGEGEESVYLYFNPNDRRLAELEKRDEWECKIGRTEGSVSARVLDQGVRTALSHTPIVGLLIKTLDSVTLERALHASLRLADQTVEDSQGAEWFHTSPTRVKAWYESFTRGLEQLKSPTSQ